MKRTIADERRIVRRLSKAMLVKLRKNSHKRNWKTESVHYLFRRAFEEMWELRAELLSFPVDRDKVLYECADVANIVAMIADKVKHDSRKKTFNRRSSARDSGPTLR
jgi:NTP pyrophosphatase (non-canonical NTP hydrolase)